jgi:hypothetical protein
LVDFDHKALILQATTQVAAGTVDELGFTACDGAKVVNAALVVDVTKSVDLGLDPSFDMTR